MSIDNKYSLMEILSNLNCILLLIGFPLFTMLAYDSSVSVSSNLPSIAFRAFHLLLALYLIINSKGMEYIKSGLPIFFLFFLIFCRIIYDGYIRIDMPRNVVSLLLLETVGFTFVPVFALARSFVYIDLTKVTKITYYGLVLIMVIFFYRYMTGNINVENGRVDLSAAQSTLALAKFGGWLALFSYYFILDKKQNKFICIITLLLGLYCSCIAGSRGAVFGNVIAFIFLFSVRKRMISLLMFFIFLSVLLFLFSDDILHFLSQIFPTLFKRILLTLNKGDTSGRLEIFRYCFEQFENNPLLDDWILKGAHNSVNLTAHNLTLEILSSLGLMGVLFLVYLYLCLFRAVYYISNISENIIWCALFICMFFMSFTGGSLRNPDYSTIYIMVLLIYGKTINEYRNGSSAA